MARRYTLTPWGASQAPSTSELTNRLRQEGHEPVLRSDPPRWHQDFQRHPYPKTWWVLMGWLRFRFRNGNGRGTQETVVRTGDRLDLPPDVPYEVEVLGDGYATYLLTTPFALPPGMGDQAQARVGPGK